MRPGWRFAHSTPRRPRCGRVAGQQISPSQPPDGPASTILKASVDVRTVVTEVRSPCPSPWCAEIHRDTHRGSSSHCPSPWYDPRTPFHSPIVIWTASLPERLAARVRHPIREGLPNMGQLHSPRGLPRGFVTQSVRASLIWDSFTPREACRAGSSPNP